MFILQNLVDVFKKSNVLILKAFNASQNLYSWDASASEINTVVAGVSFTTVDGAPYEVKKLSQPLQFFMPVGK